MSHSSPAIASTDTSTGRLRVVFFTVFSALVIGLIQSNKEEHKETIEETELKIKLLRAEIMELKKESISRNSPKND